MVILFVSLNPPFKSGDLNVSASSSWYVDQELCIELQNFLHEKFSHIQTKSLIWKIMLGTMETTRSSPVTRGEEGGMNRWSTEDLGQWNYSVWFYHGRYIIHLSKSKERTPRLNHNVNYGLGKIIMCKCKVINYNKCTIVPGGYW